MRSDDIAEVVIGEFYCITNPCDANHEMNSLTNRIFKIKKANLKM